MHWGSFLIGLAVGGFLGAAACWVKMTNGTPDPQ